MKVFNALDVQNLVCEIEAEIYCVEDYVTSFMSIIS